MASITIPPWLEPQPFAQMYAQGVQSGISAAAQQNEARQQAARLAATLAVQNAQLQQEAQKLQAQVIMDQAKMKLAQEEMQQNATQNAMKLEVEKQKNEINAALRENQLANYAENAAARLAMGEERLNLARQRFDFDVQRKETGPTIRKVTLENGREVYLTPNGAQIDVNKLTPAQDAMLKVLTSEVIDARRKVLPGGYGQNVVDQAQEKLDRFLNSIQSSSTTPITRFYFDPNNPGRLIK